MEHVRSADLGPHAGVLPGPRMRRFAFVVVLVMIALGGIVHRAAAQDAEDAEAAALDRAARELFAAGMAAVEDSRFDSAVEQFQRAYDLSHRPALLYNVGYAADRARQDEVALQAYEEYVRLAPDGEYRARAETRIAFIAELLAEAAPTAPEREPAAAPRTEAAPASTVEAATEVTAADLSATEVTAADLTGAHWTLALGAVLAASGGTALAFGFVDQDAVENPRSGAPWDEVSAAYERGPALLTTGYVVAAVGLAAVATGIVWAVVGGSEDSSVAWTPWGVEGSF